MPFIRPEWIANCLGLQDDSAKAVAGEIQDLPAEAGKET